MGAWARRSAGPWPGRPTWSWWRPSTPGWPAPTSAAQLALDAPLVVSADLEALAEAGAEVVVDFTVAEAARPTLPWCAERGIHAVVGTTGLDRGRRGRPGAGLRRARRPTPWWPPTSPSGRCCSCAAASWWPRSWTSVEVIELHHEHKRDAPSGTALHTAELIAAARRAAEPARSRPTPPPSWSSRAPAGARGPGGVRVHSVRLPGLVAHEEVIFGALGQSLTLRHDAYDRRSFMPGVLWPCAGSPERPGLTVGLGALLGV